MRIPQLPGLRPFIQLSFLHNHRGSTRGPQVSMNSLSSVLLPPLLQGPIFQPHPFRERRCFGGDLAFLSFSAWSQLWDTPPPANDVGQPLD